jgi:hypothetical protein
MPCDKWAKASSGATNMSEGIGGHMSRIAHVDMMDFTSTTSPYPFAYTPQDAANALRRLADQVENGEAVIQKLTQTHHAPLHDFQVSQLVIDYVRKRE